MKSPTKHLGVRVCIILSLAGVGGPTLARADEAAKREKVEELFRIMQMDKMVPQMTQQMMAQTQQMMAMQAQKMNLPPDAAPKIQEVQMKMMALVNERFSWPKLRPQYVKVYLDTFTEGEIEGIINFYKTPAGQAFLKKTPLLTQNIMQLTQGIMGDLLAEIPRMLDEINKQSDAKPQ